MVFIQALVLIDTLLVIWWYTDVTAGSPRPPKRRCWCREAVTQLWPPSAFGTSLPVAARRPSANGGYEYCVKNIGSVLQ